MPIETREEHLYDAFRNCGRILDIRLNYNKRFCHIQFLDELSAEKGVTYINYWLRVGPENSPAHVSKLNVNYAHQKDTEKEGLQFSPKNMNIVSQQLKDKITFDKACMQIKRWLEQGCNTPDTASSFFALISAVHDKAQQVVEGAARYNQSVRTMLEEARDSTLDHCEFIEEILEVAAVNPKAWENFTRPQQNSVCQWLEWLKSYNTGLKEKTFDISLGSFESNNCDNDLPSKKMKLTDEGEHYREEIRKLKSELEASKTKYVQELSSKQHLVEQLTSVSQQFRERHPEEWKAASEEQMALQQPSVRDTSGDRVEPSNGHHGGLSQHEIAIVSVLGTFLAVHPLGATLGEIAEYAGTFNPNLQYDYIEGLMRRLPEIFRVNKPEGDDEAKWWFLGFQSMSLPYHPTVQ